MVKEIKYGTTSLEFGKEDGDDFWTFTSRSQFSSSDLEPLAVALGEEIGCTICVSIEDSICYFTEGK